MYTPLSKEHLKCVLNNMGWARERIQWMQGGDGFPSSFIKHGLEHKSIHLFDGTKGTTNYDKIVPVSSWVKPEDLPAAPGWFPPLPSCCHASCTMYYSFKRSIIAPFTHQI